MQFHVDLQLSSSTCGTMVKQCALMCRQQCINSYGLLHDSVLLLCKRLVISTTDVLAPLQNGFVTHVSLQRTMAQNR